MGRGLFRLGLHVYKSEQAKREQRESLRVLASEQEKQNIVELVFRLAFSYSSGQCAPHQDVDYAEVVWLYSVIAEHDIGRAFNNLGCHYAMGIGVPTDEHLALALFLRASKLRPEHSNVNLARAYELGFASVAADTNTALDMYAKALASPSRFLSHDTLKSLRRTRAFLWCVSTPLTKSEFDTLTGGHHAPNPLVPMLSLLATSESPGVQLYLRQTSTARSDARVGHGENRGSKASGRRSASSSTRNVTVTFRS
jgi:hypothetical protein